MKIQGDREKIIMEISGDMPKIEEKKKVHFKDWLLKKSVNSLVIL